MSSQKRPNVAEPLIQPLVPAIQTGTVTGLVGICLGGAVGVLRSAHPGMAAMFTGVQFFALGGSFTYTRQATLLLRGAQGKRQRDLELQATTFAGALSGAIAGRFWSRPAMVAGAILFGAAGYWSQNSIHRAADLPEGEREYRTFMQRLADSRLSPIKSLSNNDYEKMLLDKIEKIEVEIAMADDKLLELKRQQQKST